MLQYNKIDASEGIDIIKLNKSNETMIFHYWYFKDTGYQFEPCFWNNRHDISMMAYELRNIALVSYTNGFHF